MAAVDAVVEADDVDDVAWPLVPPTPEEELVAPVDVVPAELQAATSATAASVWVAIIERRFTSRLPGSPSL
jgi:hypothetical protein